jgi:hypothetical protein
VHAVVATSVVCLSVRRHASIMVAGMVRQARSDPKAFIRSRLVICVGALAGLVGCEAGDVPMGVDDAPTTVERPTGPAAAAGRPTTSGSTITAATAASTLSPADTVPPALRVIRRVSPPNGRLVIGVPEDSVRSVVWLLDRLEADGSWTQTYAINTNPEGAPQTVYRLAEEPIAVPDVAIRGPGPDSLAIPDDIAPGAWRACPAGLELGCVRFDVSAGGTGAELVVPADPLLIEGRSYVAMTDRTDDTVRIGLVLPPDMEVATAYLDRADGGAWTRVGSVQPVTDAGGFVLDAITVDPGPARLCLAGLPLDVACVLLPTH